MPDWQPITDAAGNVAGWVLPADSDEPDVDYFDADRLPKVRRRAGIIADAAIILSPEFDLETSWDALEETGLPEGDIDAAAYVVLTLEKVERRYDGPDPTG